MQIQRQMFLYILAALCGCCILASCQSTNSSGLSASQTAEPVIMNAMHASLIDASFTILQSNRGGGGNFDLHGVGLYTAHPLILEETYLDQNGNKASQYIYANLSLYFRTSQSSTWMKQGDPQPGGRASAVLNYEALQQSRLIGVEEIDGKTAYHIRGTTPGLGLGTVTLDYWLAQNTYFPLKRQSVISSGSSTVTLIWTFTAWNTGIFITLPMLPAL